MKKVFNYVGLLSAFLLFIYIVNIYIVKADERTALTNIEATSNINSIVGYGLEIQKPTFTVTEGTEAYIDTTETGWYKKENNKWVSNATGYPFSSGSWQYRAKVKVDGEYGSAYTLNSYTTVKVNGEEWQFSFGNASATSSVGTIYSPTYEIEATGELEFFLKESFRIWTTYINEAAYPVSVASGVEGGTAPYVFTKVSGPAWLSVSEDGTISGTPTVVGTNQDIVVKVTDAEGSYKSISVPVDKTILPPSMREIITNIEATSNTSSIPILGGELIHPTFNMTVGQPATFEEYSGGWYKKIRDGWELQTGTFTPGEWKYRIHVAVSGEAAESYWLNNDTVVTIDGKDWGFAIDGYANEYIYGWVNSEVYTVRDYITSIELGGSFAEPKIGDDITEPNIWIRTVNNDQLLINYVDVTSKWQYKTGDGFYDWEDATGKFEANKTYHIRLMITVNSDLYDLNSVPIFPVTFSGYNLSQFQLNEKTVGEFIEFPKLEESTTPETPVIPETLTTPVLKISGNNNSLILTWNKQTIATKYLIYRSLDGKKYTKLTEVASNQYTNKNLTYKKTYYYKVRACNTSKCTGYSNAVYKKVLPNKVVLKISSASTNNINLSWGKVATTGYEVYRSTNNKKWTKLSTIKKNTTLSYNNKRLASNKVYYYKVRAYKTVGYVKVYGPFSSVVSTRTAPVKPTLTLGMKNINEMNLKIGASKGATKYNIQKSVDGGKTYTTVENVKASGILAQAGLTTGKTYYFRVRACNAQNRCSAFVVKSLKSTTRTPTITLTTTSKRVKIVVNKVLGADGYEIYRATSQNRKYILIRTLPTKNDVFEHLNTTIKGRTYYYKVRAYVLVNDKKVYSSYSSVKKIVSK